MYAIFRHEMLATAVFNIAHYAFHTDITLQIDQKSVVLRNKQYTYNNVGCDG
jgi:hypothetical protein